MDSHRIDPAPPDPVFDARKALARVARFLLAAILLLAAGVAAGATGVEPAAQAGASAGDRNAGKQNAGDRKATGQSATARAVDTDVAPELHFTGREPDSAPLPYHRIAPDTYFLYGNIAELDTRNRGFNGNAGFIVTPAGVVVIDALGSPKLGRRLIATVRAVTDRPIRVLILTHNHPDHSYGAVAFRELPGVKIIAHEGALEYLNSSNFVDSVAYRRRLIAEDMRGFRPVKPDVTVGGPMFSVYRFELGGKSIEVYNLGRHHSFGDLVVHQPDAGVLWVSDLAFNNRITFMGDGHSGQTLEGIAWLRRTFKDAKLVVPGHGSAQTPPFPMLDQTYRYVERLRAEMRRAVEDGVDLASAVRDSDFKEWSRQRLYEENHKKNANFVYREMEQEFFGN